VSKQWLHNHLLWKQYATKQAAESLGLPLHVLSTHDQTNVLTVAARATVEALRALGVAL
jgi:hypothetical protein